VAELTSDQDTAIRAGLQQAVEADSPGVLITRYAIVLEVATPEGSRNLWRYSDPAMTGWDAWGFLAYAVLGWDTGEVEDG
jgi:hypothetical protein